MIIYLYGPDAYRRQEKLKWYLDKFKEKYSSLTVESFDLENENELVKLKEFATAQSLFESSKFGILHNLSEADPKELEGVFKISIDSKILTLAISVEKELSKDLGFFKNKSGIVAEEFKLPTAAAFADFIKTEADKRKIKLSPDQSRVLIKNYQNDTWGLITELDKIALGGSPESLEEINFFMLVSKLQKAGNVKQVLPALERLLSENEPAMLFNFLASRAYGETKPGSESSTSGISPREAGRTSTSWKTKMADYDVAIKSGKLEYEEALFDLAVSN